jgi:hypothetical protein
VQAGCHIQYQADNDIFCCSRDESSQGKQEDAGIHALFPLNVMTTPEHTDVVKPGDRVSRQSFGYP